MRYLKQTFGNMESIYAIVYGTHKNGNLKAVFISDIRKKAVKTSIMNQDVWTPISRDNIPSNLFDKIIIVLGR